MAWIKALKILRYDSIILKCEEGTKDFKINYDLHMKRNSKLESKKGINYTRQ